MNMNLVKFLKTKFFYNIRILSFLFLNMDTTLFSSSTITDCDKRL
jgi:hypothetical protein